MSISGAQVEEVRRLLGWPLSVVGGKSDLSTSTISFFETGKRRPSSLNVSTIRKVFEAAGVEFIAENGDGSGCGCERGSDCVIRCALVTRTFGCRVTI